MSPGEGGRDDSRIVRPGGERDATAPGARTLGMLLFLASLTMLFAAGIAGYLVVRLRAESWPPPGAPGLPRTLWLSTALVLGSSATIQAALAAIRKGNPRRLVAGLGATLVLSVLFLASQSWSWARMLGAATFRSDLYGFTFVMLTGLHGAHVLGGLIAVAVVLVLALRGAYTWAHYPGVRNCALYWHFLSAVWLVLYAVLLAG